MLRIPENETDTFNIIPFSQIVSNNSHAIFSKFEICDRKRPKSYMVLLTHHLPLNILVQLCNHVATRSLSLPFEILLFIQMTEVPFEIIRVGRKIPRN